LDWAGVATILIIIGLVFGTVPVLVWLERRLSAKIQLRVGPVLTGFPDWWFLGPLRRARLWGLVQTLADAVKFIFKEDFVPASADKFLFRLAPFLVFIPALLGIAAIPFAGEVTWLNGVTRELAVFPTEISVLFVLAATSLGVHGLTLAGWASNNKYSQMAGVRASAQLISYEAPMFIALLAVLMSAGTMSFNGVVYDQVENGWFILRQPLAFVIFYICTYAETNRAPFDMPEAEPELIGGYHTEYGGMRFAMFFLGEYAAMIAMCSILTLCFLGGWTIPGTDWHLLLGGWMGFPIMFTKVFLLLVIMIWVRWSLPRFRYDQLMTLGWKRLTPLAMLNLALTAVAGVLIFK
jgi:NADH-quinone oxidoreductase subunit H